MDELTKKSDFRSAYETGNLAVENRRRPFSVVQAVGLGMALILALEITKWLGVRFQFSGFEKNLLDDAARVIVSLAYFLWLWRIIPIKRNKT